MCWCGCGSVHNVDEQASTCLQHRNRSVPSPPPRPRSKSPLLLARPPRVGSPSVVREQYKLLWFSSLSRRQRPLAALRAFYDCGSRQLLGLESFSLVAARFFTPIPTAGDPAPYPVRKRAACAIRGGTLRRQKLSSSLTPPGSLRLPSALRPGRGRVYTAASFPPVASVTPHSPRPAECQDPTPNPSCTLRIFTLLHRPLYRRRRCGTLYFCHLPAPHGRWPGPGVLTYLVRRSAAAAHASRWWGTIGPSSPPKPPPLPSSLCSTDPRTFVHQPVHLQRGFGGELGLCPPPTQP